MRYLPHTEADRAAMLAAIGAASVDDLFADVPADLLLRAPLDLPTAKSEAAVERALAAMAARNITASAAPSFCGAGAYRHHVPATVDHLIQRSEFLTSYTPYQPEISQGTLQTLFEFQTQVALLTDMEVANASMYDGSTAAAEAVAMAARITGRKVAVLSGALHPHYRATVETQARMSGRATRALAPDVFAREDLAAALGPDVACVVAQTPDFFGNPRDLADLGAACRAAGAL
ncbi:MAG: glycine dehydrogenase, partial [Hyphomicrobiales bacterium]|nr:glycine dehydrogenase [Hyphomicrobiales bacterium]